MNHWLWIIASLGCIASLLSAADIAQAATEPAATKPSDADLWTSAPARIEQHRKGDLSVTVTDATGKPVPGAQVSIEQTSHAFLFGCNIFSWGDEPDRYRKGMPAEIQDAYRARFAELFNYATLPFYWHYYEPEAGRTRHEYMASLATWCRDNGIATKGHPLMWNNIDPAWLPKDPQEVQRLQKARVEDLVGRFAKSIDRWDVVNELTDFARNNGKAPKQTQAWSVDLAKACFATARKANPAATLLINDYRTDAAYAKRIESLVDDQGKRLYDIIGVQSHQHSGVWASAKTWEVCQRFAGFGVPLHFTEATILSGKRLAGTGPGEARDASQWSSTPTDEAKQAADAVRFYTVLFSHPSVEAITWWDLIDGYTWQGAPSGLLHKDATPKPIYNELKTLIRQTWWTRTTATTDAQGRVATRGFYGSYRVTVRIGEKVVAEGTFTLRKGSDNRWTLQVP